jgi:hypothetical protein
MDMQKIKQDLTEPQPLSFLKAVLAQPVAEDSLLTFSEQVDAQFVENCRFLASPETISEEELAQWRQKDFLVVAQTIDGDYLAGTIDQTLVIPVSLYKADIEFFDCFLTDFLIAYEKGSIVSRILPSLG